MTWLRRACAILLALGAPVLAASPAGARERTYRMDAMWLASTVAGPRPDRVASSVSTSFRKITFVSPRSGSARALRMRAARSLSELKTAKPAVPDNDGFEATWRIPSLPTVAEGCWSASLPVHVQGLQIRRIPVTVCRGPSDAGRTRFTAFGHVRADGTEVLVHRDWWTTDTGIPDRVESRITSVTSQAAFTLVTTEVALSDR